MIAGRYSLDREIGRGGTGPVWLARDETLHRSVAMKRIGLLPGADETDLARAEREARLSAHLHHPHVVQVYDVAVAEDDLTHWLVMEYVEGPSLGQLVKQRGGLPPDEARPILAQVASALLAAHEAGIAHRDVKPSNILIDAAGDAKLTDFGIARISSDPSLTHTGLLTGSPAYLAPEVAEGGTGDQRSDVWSLGATAFHVLAGRPPYEVDGNVLGTLFKIVHDDPPRLEDAGSLSGLLEGAMTKDPDLRWTMKQVVDDLSGPPGASTPTLVQPAPVAAAGTPDPGSTQVLTGPVPAEPAAAPPPEPRGGRGDRDGAPRWLWWVLAGLAGLVLLVLLVTSLGDGDAGSRDSRTGTTTSPRSSPTPSPTSSSPSPTAEQGPTAAGMEQFVEEYVRRVGSDPATSWPMLTEGFQRKSGGFEQYREFWEGARDGQVENVEADPTNLTVSYDVKWKGHSNGPTTRLALVHEDGRYLIDDEFTQGFEPSG